MLTYKEQKLVRERREAAGLCGYCGKIPPREEKKMCQPCAEKAGQSNRKVKAQRVAQHAIIGLCSSCTEPVVLGRKMCEFHLVQNLEVSKARRARCKIEGTCFACSSPAINKTYCEVHRDLYRGKQTKERKNRKLNGVCVDCGKVPPRDGMVTCQSCSEIGGERWKAARDRRVTDGLCIYCEGQVTPGVGRPSLSCDTCRGVRKGYNKTIENRFSRSRNGRSAQQHGWYLSLDQYKSIVEQPCAYCLLPNDSGSCGLDRLNNKGGYSVENVVSCCSICNMVRNNIFTPEEMKALGAVVRAIKMRRRESFNDKEVAQ